MAWTLTKVADGDMNLGSLNAAEYQLQPAAADYVQGTGYQIVDGVFAVDTPSAANTVNVDLYRVLGILAYANSGGYVLGLTKPTSPTQQKSIRVYRQNATTGALQECPTATDLSAQTFDITFLGL